MTIPQDIPVEVQALLGHVVAAQQAIDKAAGWLDTARKDRDHYIAQLRLAGWTLGQISAFTGLSTSMLEKISRQQGLVSTRGAKVAVT